MAEIDESKVNETTTQEVPPAVGAKKPDGKVDEEIARLKAALSKANSEAADYKRQLRDKQTAEEKAEAERAEREAAREARIAELEAKERVSTYKSWAMDAGYDGATADLLATALPTGVSEDFFTALKTFNANQRKAADVSALNNQPGLSVGLPPSGSGKSALDEKLDKIFGL